MFQAFLADYELMYNKIMSFIQDTLGVIRLDELTMETVFPIACEVAIAVLWINIFLSIFKAVKERRESFVCSLLCSVTGTDFGLFNSTVLMAVTCAAMYLIGPVEACCILGLSLFQFRQVGKSFCKRRESNG